MSILYLKYTESTIPVIFHGFLCIFAYLFWACLVALTLPIFAIFKCFRLVEKAWVTYYKQLGTALAIVDLPFIHDSVENRNFITALMTIQGKLDVQKLRKLVEDKIVRSQPEASYIRMKKRVIKCYNTYLWQDEENFDIKDHIPVYNKGKITTKRQLERLYSELSSKPISDKISPWQFTVIKMDSKEEKYAIHFIIHHCIGDGFAMVGLLCQLVDGKPKLVTPRKNQGVMANPARRVVKGILTGPLSLMALLFSRYVGNPFQSKVPPSRKSVSWTDAIDLETIKLLKNKTDSTVNDVITSCIAGAIRQYLQDKGTENPDDQPITMTYNSRKFSQKLLECIPLGNQSGALFLKLPVSIADSIKRLQITKARINAMKNSADPHLFSFVYSFVIGHMPEFISRLSVSSVNRHCSLVYSNVPGPVEKIQVAGDVIDSMMVTPPLAFDLGVSIAVLTYAGTLRMTVLSDERVIKEPGKLTQAFQDEVNRFALRIAKLD